MEYKALKNFKLSRDGLTCVEVKTGDLVEIPLELTEGLVDAGFVEPSKEQKSLPVPFENKMEPPVENKREVAKGPRGLWFVMEDGNRVSKGFKTEEEALNQL